MDQKATNALLALLDNGESISKLYQRSKDPNGNLNWARFQESMLKNKLTEKILGVSTSQIDAALAEVRAERERLRAQWKGKPMPGEVIDRLSVLSDIGVGLVDSKLDVGLTPKYVTWMMDKAVPVLKTAVGIIL